MVKKLQKIYLTYNNLLIVQDLWQAYYQILLIIFLRELKKLNAKMYKLTKNVKLVELHTKYAAKHSLTENKCLCCNKSYQQYLMKG